MPGKYLFRKNEAVLNCIEIEKEECKISIQNCNFGYFLASNNLTVEQGTHFKVIIP